MENRRKFYTPKKGYTNWSTDSIDERYKHINNVLQAHTIMEYEDLKFVIKNAFISRIYISVDAHKKLKGVPLNSLQNLFNMLDKYRVLDLQDNGSRLRPYFDICKIGDKGMGISIEHVVPGDVYIKEALKQKSFSKNVFKAIFDKCYICLVTSDQAKLLDKKYKSKMPPNPNTGDDYNFVQFPFARYDKSLGGVGIEIHGWTMQNGNLK